MEDYSVYGSEEEADDPPDAETDEDLTDEERDAHEVATMLSSNFPSGICFYSRSEHLIAVASWTNQECQLIACLVTKLVHK